MWSKSVSNWIFNGNRSPAFTHARVQKNSERVQTKCSVCCKIRLCGYACLDAGPYFTFGFFFVFFCCCFSFFLSFFFFFFFCCCSIAKTLIRMRGFDCTCWHADVELFGQMFSLTPAYISLPNQSFFSVCGVVEWDGLGALWEWGAFILIHSQFFFICLNIIYSRISFAYRSVAETAFLNVKGRSFMKSRNKRGPKIDRCGTPHKIVSISECIPFMEIVLLSMNTLHRNKDDFKLLRL